MTQGRHEMKKEIYYRKHKQPDYTKPASERKDGYRWAWKESWEVRVYGWAVSLDEIKQRAQKMFPDHEIVLSLR